MDLTNAMTTSESSPHRFPGSSFYIAACNKSHTAPYPGPAAPSASAPEYRYIAFGTTGFGGSYGFGGGSLRIVRPVALLTLFSLVAAASACSQSPDHSTMMPTSQLTSTSSTTVADAAAPMDPNSICTVETVAAASSVSNPSDAAVTALARAIGQKHPMFHWSLELVKKYNETSFNQGAAAARAAVHEQATAFCAGAGNPVLDGAALQALLPLVPPDSAELLTNIAESVPTVAAAQMNGSDLADVCSAELVAIANLFGAQRSSDAFQALGIHNQHLTAGQQLWSDTFTLHINSGAGAASTALRTAASEACSNLHQATLSQADLGSLIAVAEPEDAAILSQVSYFGPDSSSVTDTPTAPLAAPADEASSTTNAAPTIDATARASELQAADLGLSVPISRPLCDGRVIIVLFSATDPSRYAQSVQGALDANPGSSYLRTDPCSPFPLSGDPIYAVYKPVPEGANPCDALSAAPAGSYARYLDSEDVVQVQC